MENEFEYCMPDELETKEQHEQYLKDIGYDEWLKKQSK